MPQQSIPASLQGILDSFAGSFTRPSFENFVALISGWILCQGRHCVSRLIQVAAKKFNQLDSYVFRRLRRFLVKRNGRNLKAGEAAKWTREFFWSFGLHRLRGTVRYPETV